MDSQVSIEKNVDFFRDYWDILFGIVFGVLALYFHYTHSSILLTTILATIAIGSVSVTISEIAEILAHRFGEPFGSLILTFSAVAVEILILFMVLLEATHNPQAVTAVKNGIISTFIVDLNALLGIAMFVGGLAYKEQNHNEDTSSSYTTVLFVAAAMLLVPSTLSVGHTEENVFHASIAISVLLAIFFIFILNFRQKHISIFSNQQQEVEYLDIKKKFKRMMKIIFLRNKII